MNHNSHPSTPPRAEFMDKIGSQLYTKQIAEYIYDILFTKQLAQLDTQELQVLSTLFNAENPNDSEKILQTIKQNFPTTAPILSKIHEHKNLFPISLLDTSMIEHIQQIQENIFTLFDPNHNDEHELTKLIQHTLRKIFLSKIRKNLGETSYQKCIDNFHIEKYEIKQPKNILRLQTTSKEYFNRFEEELLPYFITSYKHTKIPKPQLKYIIKPQPNDTNTTPRITNKEKQTKININSSLTTHMQRENCFIPNKEKIYQHISNTNNHDHIYIYAPQGAGKTHLVQALYHKLKTENSKQKIIYITANDFYRKYIESANKDRNYRKRMTNYKNAYLHSNNFRQAFQGSDYIFLDNIEQIQGNKKATQQILQQIIKQTGAKLIMTSSLMMNDIIFNKKIHLSHQEGYDYQSTNITEIFAPTLIKLPAIPNHQKKQIANIFLQKNLFDNTTNEGIIKLLIEKDIPLNLFESILKSIEFNYNKDAKNAFQIIQNMTGSVIKPYHNEILQIILDSFNDDNIQKFINIRHTGGFPKTEKIKNFSDIKGNLIHTTDGIMLRTAIYFIKKYYPQESFEEIGKKFDRSSSSIASLQKESKEYFKDNPQIVEYFDTQIHAFLQKKYGLEDLDGIHK